MLPLLDDEGPAELQPALQRPDLPAASRQNGPVHPVEVRARHADRTERVLVDAAAQAELDLAELQDELQLGVVVTLDARGSGAAELLAGRVYEGAVLGELTLVGGEDAGGLG